MKGLILSDLCTVYCGKTPTHAWWPCANCGHFRGYGCCGRYKLPPLWWRLLAAWRGAK